MRTLNLYSINAKLTLMIMATSCAAVLVASVIYAVNDGIQLRQDMQRDLSILAEVIGNRSAVALQFDDKSVTEQNLAALRANKSIVDAAIYGADGRVFASYSRDKQKAAFPERLPGQAQSGFAEGFLAIFVPIVVDEERLGTVYFRSDLNEISKRQLSLLLIFAAIVVVSLGVALFLSARLQRLLSVPIMHLIDTARKISAKKDYSIRARKFGEDELGILVETFNDMLAQIQSREVALRQSEKKYRSIYENANDGIFQTMPGGRLVTANPAMVRILGYDSVDELIAKFTNILAHGYVNAEDVAALEACFAQSLPVSNFEAPMYKKNGEIIYIAINARNVTDDEGNLLHFEGSIVDITERKEKERTQRELFDAEQASKAKSEFLAIMSHEIRTPMNIIMGMAHLALQTDLSTKQLNFIEKIDSASKGLLGIINDILDFSKIEAGKVVFEQIDFALEEVMEKLADLAVTKTQDKGLELLFDLAADVPTALIGDPLRLGQVLTNLINNAIKFTEKGEVKVSVRCLQHDQSNVRLEFAVADTGVGLSEDELRRLFTAFTQADSSTTRKYGGTGLGLTISKRLVEMMEGEISVVSQPGQGSTFRFSVKLGVQSEQKPQRATIVDLEGLRVLVVDDNASAREISQAMLGTLGFEAKAVASAEEALAELLEAQQQGAAYDLVLMDWLMPGINGIEAIREICMAADLFNKPRCMLVTAYSREELLKQVVQARIEVDGLISKPISPSLLCDSIMTAFKLDGGHQPRKQQQLVGYLEAQQVVRGARLLLVEDNAMNQEVALEILGAAGISVDVAGNGQEALAQLERGAYDGVLMDCLMPVMDGFEATRKIRADLRFSQLPVIAMTANAMAGDRQKCLDSGMNDHIAKPVNVVQLFTTLARWVKPSGTAPVVRVVPSQESSAVDVPHLAGLETEAALARIGGNTALYCKMLLRFREGQANAAQRIAQALRAGDREMAVRLAHMLKGVAGNIGAERLVKATTKLERALKLEHDDAADELLPEVEKMLAALIEAMDQAMPLPQAELVKDSASNVDINREKLQPLLRRLLQLLAEDDMEATVCVDTLLGMARGSRLEEDFVRLDKAIKRLAFDEALRVLREITGQLGLGLVAGPEGKN